MSAGAITSLAAPAFVLLLAFALTLWFRRKALAAPAEARTSVWFWSFRFLRYLTLGTIALWWIATDWVGLKARAWIYWQMNAPEWIPARHAIFLFCFWIPPIIVIITCQSFFRPVYAQIRGVHWTRSELVRQAAFGLGISLVPVLLVVGGVLEITEGGGLTDLVISYALAIFSWVGSVRALRKQLQLTPNALTTGELRDRAFALANRIGVKLQQIYLLPPGKSRLANAFARSGNSILITEVLLTDLNKREVDCVLGHELSHLKQNHPQLLGFALLGGLALVMTPYYMLAPSSTWQPLFDVLFITVPLLTLYFVSRRFEYAADAGSIRLTGDPAAMITGLVKLHQLNLIPLEWSKWSEKSMTHPSTVRRARAIGRAAEMPDERVNELLAAPVLPGSGCSDQHYVAPPTIANPKVFSSLFKRQSAMRAFLAFAALAVLLPSALLRVLSGLPWPVRGWPALAMALALCLVATILFVNRAPFFGFRGLCRRLRERLASEKLPVNHADAVLVGLAPGSEPRIFEWNFSWDVGCLLLTPDRLCYWGEETSFALRREQIISVEAGRGMPDWFRSQFLYIRWRAAAGEPEATFNIRPVEVSSTFAMGRAFRALEQRISQWRMGSSTAGTGPDAAASLPLPVTGQVTSASLSAARGARQILPLVMFTAFISGLTATLLKLPIEWVAPIDFGQDTAGYAGISGWYAILLSLLMVFFRFGPTWLFRQPEPSSAGPLPPPPLPARKPDPSDAR